MNSPTLTTISKTEARAANGMVATKDVHATMAGVSMLENGGNAVDAAVAACFAVGVVEPASSGIGGGGYLVYQVGDRGGVIGFPMKGPLAATPDMYELTGEAAVGNFGWAGVVNDENLEGYRSIAVPGAVAGLCEAHRRLGKLPLSEVLAPAVSLARDGHSPGWHNIYSLGLMAGKLFLHEELRRVFMPGGNLPAGDLTSLADFRQPELADVLETVGREGAKAFYTGDIARALVSDIQDNGGILSDRDLAEYAPFVWDGGLEFYLLRPHGPSSPVRMRGHHLRYDPALGRRSRHPLAGAQLRRRPAQVRLGREAGIRRQVPVHGRPVFR